MSLIKNSKTPEIQDLKQEKTENYNPKSERNDDFSPVVNLSQKGPLALIKDFLLVGGDLV